MNVLGFTFIWLLTKYFIDHSQRKRNNWSKLRKFENFDVMLCQRIHFITSFKIRIMNVDILGSCSNDLSNSSDSYALVGVWMHMKYLKMFWKLVRVILAYQFESRGVNVDIEIIDGEVNSSTNKKNLFIVLEINLSSAPIQNF